MRSFAIDEPGSSVRALYATLVWIIFFCSITHGGIQFTFSQIYKSRWSPNNCRKIDKFSNKFKSQPGMENVGDNFPSWVFTFGVKLTKYWRSSLTPVGIIQKFEKCQTNAFSHTHVDLLWNFWFPLKIVWRIVIKTNVELFEFLLCGQNARNKNTCLAYWTERGKDEKCALCKVGRVIVVRKLV